MFVYDLQKHWLFHILVPIKLRQPEHEGWYQVVDDFVIILLLISGGKTTVDWHFITPFIYIKGSFDFIKIIMNRVFNKKSYG